jgi:hypothetical protein
LLAVDDLRTPRPCQFHDVGGTRVGSAVAVAPSSIVGLAIATADDVTTGVMAPDADVPVAVGTETVGAVIGIAIAPEMTLCVGVGETMSSVASALPAPTSPIAHTILKPATTTRVARLFRVEVDGAMAVVLPKRASDH